uniref:EOG090X032R n=1 Tax=Daphnia dolichocephala TaxID=2282166 RepID=A0A4Y7M019_9CRUS|nr:EOG090X032R [Daphnia dolichocephala]
MVKGKKVDTVDISRIQTGMERQQPPSANELVKEIEETPPPSLPPSPPPSPPPSLPPSRPPSPPPSPTFSARSRDSEWSIDVEELSDEPRPAIQSRKDNSKRQRRRSSSWSRSLMNSFRKKKKDKELKLGELYKTEPLPDDFSTEAEKEMTVKNVPIDPELQMDKQELPEKPEQVHKQETVAIVAKSSSTEGQQKITPEATDKVPSSERNNRMSRILSFGTFGRRKSIPIQHEQVADERVESEIQEYPEIKVLPEQEKNTTDKSDAKAKVDKEGKRDEADGESGESKPQSKNKSKKKVKSKLEKKNKNSRMEKSTENLEGVNEMLNDADNESSPKIAKLEKREGKESKKVLKKAKQKSIFSFRSSSKTIDQIKPEMNINVEPLNVEQREAMPDTAAKKEQPPDSVKPKRKTIANLFKREKSPKEDEVPKMPATIPDMSNMKKSDKLRNSFARIKKTKSVDAEATPDEVEKEKKSRRTSLAFGSSFSLKKIFQNDSQPDVIERHPASPVLGMLMKRNKRSSTTTATSVQLDDDFPNTSQTELRSSRTKIGERFLTFTRDSLRIKRWSKSVEQTLVSSPLPALHDENPTISDDHTPIHRSSVPEGPRQVENLTPDELHKSLLEAYDTVLETLQVPGYPFTQESFGDPTFGNFDSTSWEMPADISAVRAVGIRKNPGEPLGLTVKTEDGQLVIARILAGGAVDRQGLLHVGDIIGEVNGVVVRSAEQLQVEIARCREHIQLKILPSYQENGSNGAQCCVRAHFDYDPKEDKLLPCPEIGLAFKKGDILQVVNQSDPNWWQAKKVGWSGPAGLIPSQELEERRKAFVAPEADFVHKIGFCGTRISKKKKKLMYQIKSSVDLDKAELLLYEEVTRMPPFRRKTLVLVGSEGIGRRTLKNRLINSDPDRFGTTMPHTSRPMRELEEDGMGYWFVSREEMDHDVRDHQFLEFGEHNNHLYGTKLDSIRAVIRQGKMCVLDCSPNALKTLHNSPEFMPYVIFLAAPGMDQLKSIYENSRYSSRNLGTVRILSFFYEEDFKNALEESARIQRIYEKYFDQIIVNEDPDQTFRKVVEALEILSNQHQWVPVSWVY